MFGIPNFKLACYRELPYEVTCLCNLHVYHIKNKAHHFMLGLIFNSLGPSDAIWQQISGSPLAQEMACCLTAPSHYLNQC